MSTQYEVQILAPGDKEWTTAGDRNDHTPPAWWTHDEHEWAKERAFALSRKGFATRIIPHSDGVPLRQCEECEHQLGHVGYAIRCPLFGRPRAGVSIRCAAFEPIRPECRNGHTCREKHEQAACLSAKR